MKKILIFLCLFFGLGFYSSNANYVVSNGVSSNPVLINTNNNSLTSFVMDLPLSFFDNDYYYLLGNKIYKRNVSSVNSVFIVDLPAGYSYSAKSFNNYVVFRKSDYSNNFLLLNLLTKSFNYINGLSSSVSGTNVIAVSSNILLFGGGPSNAFSYDIEKNNLVNLGGVIDVAQYRYMLFNNYIYSYRGSYNILTGKRENYNIPFINTANTFSIASDNTYIYSLSYNSGQLKMYDVNFNYIKSFSVLSSGLSNIIVNINIEKPLYCEKVQGSAPQYFTGALISLTNNINDYNVNQINNINFQFGSKNGRSNITFLTDDTLDTYYYNSSGLEVTSTGEINQTFFDNNSYFSFNNFPASNISNFVRTSTKTFNKIYVSGSNFDYKLELYVNDNFVYYGKFKSNEYVDFINSFGGYNDINAVRITPQNGYQIGGYKIYYTDFYSSYSEYVDNEVCYYKNNIVTVDGQTVDLAHYNDVVENSVNNSFLSEYQTYFDKNCSNLNIFSQFTNLDCLFAKFILWFKDLDFLKGITNFFNQIKNIFNFSANPTSSITINHFLSSNGNSTNLVLSYNYSDIKNKLVIKEGIIKNYVNSVDKSGFIFINWIFYIIFIFIYFLSASFLPSLFIGVGISIYYFIDKIFNQIYLNSFASDVTSNNVFTTIFKFTIISFVFTIFFYLTNPVINNIIQINNFIKNFVSGILNYFYLILNYNSSFNIIDGINFISDKGFGFLATGIFIFLLGKVARLF